MTENKMKIIEPITLREKIQKEKTERGYFEFTYLLRGEVVPKKNSRITLKNGRTIPSKKYQEWHESAMIELNYQKTQIIKQKEPLSIPLEIHFTFTHSTKHRRDSDNAVSSVLDILQDCGIITDDKWQIVRSYTVKNFLSPEEESNCLINIYPYEKK